MSEKTFNTNTLARTFLGIVFLTVCSIAAIPVFIFPPGIDDPEPIGRFLDGNMPSYPPTFTAEGWDVEPAFPNITFNDPTVFVPEPNGNRLYVGSRDGIIHSFENSFNTSSKELVLDISEKVAVVWDGGFLGMAFHPDFNNGNRYFYVWYSARSYPGAEYFDSWVNDPIFFNTYLRLSRFTIPEGSLQADPNSELIMINHRLYGGTHRGGGMSFGKDGFLYLSIGEQWRYITAQDRDSTLEGGILRLDVDQNPSRSHPPVRKFPLAGGPPEQISGVGYWIPNDNPWLDPNGNYFEEYFTLGHRAPHRLTVDQETGDIWVGEVGASKREEINIIEGGNNYGWPYREGTVGGSYGATPGNLEGNLTDPIIDFTRDETVAIIGGYVYRGDRIPALRGKYLAGGHALNRLWAIDYNNGNASKEYLCQFSPGSLTTFGQDNNGEVYLCGLGQNVNIYRLKAQNGGETAPQYLSQTGLFQNLQSLSPAQGVIPYDINEPFWSDGALKYRFIAIPNDGNPDNDNERISFSEEGQWEVPVGTVLAKHFEFPVDETNPSITKRLETRLFVKAQDGSFYGLTYKWMEDGSDAVLLEGAVDEEISIKTSSGNRTQIWHYPSRSECQVCHNDGDNAMLGVNTRHWNKDFYYEESGRTANQLTTFKQIGLIDGNIDDQSVESFLSSANKYDENAPIELRARSYLDINCSYCHRPGSGNRAVFDARLSTPLDDQNLIWGTVMDNMGVNGARLIVPQSPEQSIILQRMDRIHDSYAMPPLAKNVIDTSGVRLITDWINSLDASQEPGGGTNCSPSQIAQAAWSVNYVSSEENQGEAGYARNAFDGDPTTFWHSQWYPNSVALPHEIIIDLGASYDVSGFSYLPRQDGSVNGTIADYEFYVSSSPEDWGTPVQTGTFANNALLKEVNFPSKSGKYIRLLALSEVNGGPWTSMAELNVLTSSCSKKDQYISFAELDDIPVNGGPIALQASSTSGLAVSFELVSGPASLEGNILRLNGPGQVTIRAIQNGSEEYSAAFPVERSFTILAAAGGLIAQTINFPAIADVSTAANPMRLEASASSGLLVSFRLIEGPAILDNDLLTFNGQPGTITIEAYQEGNEQYLAASPVRQSFEVADEEIPVANCVTTVLPQSRLSLYYVDSEESQGENGLAVNAFDGNLNTIWHSQWYPSNAALPHEIQLDLGKTEVVNGFSYMGRQDGEQNGNIGDFQFFVSNDPNNWGAPVYTGTFQNTPSLQSISFEEKNGQYVRLLATSEVNGGPWTTVAELNITITNCPKTPTASLQPQTIVFLPITDKLTTDGDFSLEASASSDLPITFELLEGPASLNGNLLSLSGQAGVVKVAAKQGGNEIFQAATTVQQSFNVVEALGPPSVKILNPGENSNVLLGPISLEFLTEGDLSRANRLIVWVNNVQQTQTDQFYGNVDLNLFETGVQNLKIELVDESGELLSSDSIQIFSDKKNQLISFTNPGNQFNDMDAIELQASTDSELPVEFNLISGPATLLNNTLYFTGKNGQVIVELNQSGNPIYKAAESKRIIFNVIDRPVTINCDPQWLDSDQWKLLFADSEESRGENGIAINAIDGNPNTFWHSEWYPSNSTLPHEIQIDLGSTYFVEGFSYLPRQDGESNGNIGDYQFFVSESPSNWGTAIYTSSFNNDASRKERNFEGKQGRYIRLLATSEAGGGPWTTIAELGIFAGTCPSVPVAEKQSQSINFAPIPDKLVDDASFELNASTSSGLAIEFILLEGPVSLDGNTVQIDGSGSVSIMAVQEGNDVYQAAEAVLRSFNILELPEDPSLSMVSPANNADLEAGNILLEWNAIGTIPTTASFKIDLNNGESIIYKSLNEREHLLGALSPGGYLVELIIIDQNGVPLPYPEISQQLSFNVAKARQSINFNPIQDQLLSIETLSLQANASSQLPVSFRVLSGPAIVNGNALVLTGEEGLLRIEASQPGNQMFEAAEPVIQEFNVVEQTEACPVTALDPANWELVYVDSEEFRGEDGYAVNAFDNNPNSIWHSQWYPSNDQLPHEIIIDLKEVSKISGFNYLPRQDGEQNGNIGSYEFYLSTDGINWGTAVNTGEFDGSPTQKSVRFEATSAQYVRLRALTEVNGGPWTNIAEIGIIGESCSAQLTQRNLSPANEGSSVNQLDLKVYPNPANDYIKIEGTGKEDARKVSIQISNLLGAKLQTMAFESSSNTFIRKIDISSFPAGYYIIQCQFGQDVRTFRIIKELR